MSTDTTPLLSWIICSIMGLFTFLTNTVLLKKEIDKRKSGKALFTTKTLKIYSIICILFGAIQDLIWPFFILMVSVTLVSRYLSLGFLSIYIDYFYQLSRLHYCFANEQIYSKKGYPNWLFMIMHSIGVIFMIALVPTCIATNLLQIVELMLKVCIIKAIIL